MEPIYAEYKAFLKLLLQIENSETKEYKDQFFKKIDRIAEQLEASPYKEELKEKFFKICSSLDSSLMHGRTREKPLGYAGDFQLIDWIYTQKTAASGPGKLFDQLFHTYEAAESVRNRKEYFKNKCDQMAHQTTERFDVLNLGCGSCRDVLETFEMSTNGSNLFVHCVDNEEKAVQYAKTLLENTSFKDRIKVESTNVFKIKTDHKYDLIWSSGLFDYLEKRVVIILLKKIWKLLKDNGKIIFGNFSPKNPTRNGMELVGKWNLIHRSAEELISICHESGIPFSEIEIESEPNGINLFCVISK